MEVEKDFVRDIKKRVLEKGMWLRWKGGMEKRTLSLTLGEKHGKRVCGRGGRMEKERDIPFVILHATSKQQDGSRDFILGVRT